MITQLLRHFIGALFVTCLLATGAHSEPVKLRLGYVIPIANWPSFAFEKPQILHHYGKSYTVEATQYRGTPALVNALAIGEADLVDLAFSSVAFAIENADMKDLRIIADEAQDGVEGYNTGTFYVRKNDGINKIEDLKGKVLATPGPGSAVDIVVRVMLHRHGLMEKRDYTAIEAPWPTMRPMLAEKKVDFVPTTMPFSFDPQWAVIGDRLFTIKDVLGPNQLIVMTARASTIQKHRAAIVDMLEDVIIALKYFNDPANRDEMLQIMARVGKQKPEALSDWLLTKKDYFRDPMLRPNLAGLQSAIDAQKEVGIIKSQINIKDFSDLSLIEEAGRRIK